MQKKPPPSALRDSEFDSPRQMFGRALFLVCLAGIVGGVLLVGAGAIGRRLDLASVGGLSLVAAWTLRDWLRRHGDWESACRTLDAMGDPEPAGQSARVARLRELLQQWDDAEAKRGSSGFDPWALQALRRDIHDLIGDDPGLTRLFHTYEQQKRMT